MCERTVRLALLLSAAIYAWTTGCLAADITVRVVNGKTGRPMAKQPVYLDTYKEFPHRLPNSLEPLKATTGPDGRATFSLRARSAEVLAFSVPLRGTECGRFRFSPQQVGMGVIADNLCDTKGKLKGKFTARPGEVVLFVRPFSPWDMLLREFPFGSMYFTQAGNLARYVLTSASGQAQGLRFSNSMVLIMINIHWFINVRAGAALPC